MYCIYQSEKKGFPVIHIEGRLDSAEKVRSHLIEILNSIQSAEIGSEIIIKVDLSDVEFISDKCLEVFQDLGSLYNLQFLNYSLYIEILLNEYDLL